VDVAHERGIEECFRLHPEIIPSFAFTLGFGDECRHQLQDVLFALDVGKGIVVHGFVEVDGIEDLDLIAFPQEKLSAFHYDAALGICDHIAGMALHEIGFKPKPRLARSGTAHHHDVFISCQSGVLGSVVHGQPFRLREDDVVAKGRINEGFDIFWFSPAGRAVLDVLPVLLGVSAFEVDSKLDASSDGSSKH